MQKSSGLWNTLLFVLLLVLVVMFAIQKQYVFAASLFYGAACTMISLRPLPSKSVKTVSIAVAALIGLVLVCLAFVVDNPYPYENICSAAVVIIGLGRICWTKTSNEESIAKAR